MANLFDAVQLTQNLGFFTTVFPFLLIFAFTYGLLAKFEPFGKNQPVNIIISLVLAFTFISFSKASLFLQNILPFISTMLLMLFFIVMIFMFMGVEKNTISEAMQDPAGYWMILILILLFVGITVTVVFPEFQYAARPELAPSTYVQTPQEKSFAESMAVIFHPTVLATMILFFVLAVGTYIVLREKTK